MMMQRVDSRRGGFTLVELLVVAAIVGILAAVVQFSFSGADARQLLASTAENTAARIELVRSESMQSNREFGFRLTDDGLEFLEFEPESGAWIGSGSRPRATTPATTATAADAASRSPRPRPRGRVSSSS